MINTELLKEEMQNKDCNINRLAELSRVDKSVLSRIINGKSKTCTVETAQNIANALELSNKKKVSIFFLLHVAEMQRCISLPFEP